MAAGAVVVGALVAAETGDAAAAYAVVAGLGLVMRAVERVRWSIVPVAEAHHELRTCSYALSYTYMYT